MALALLFIIPLGYILSGIASVFCKGLLVSDLNIDENLGNYFESLEMDDKKWMVMEEENIRNNYVNSL